MISDSYKRETLEPSQFDQPLWNAVSAPDWTSSIWVFKNYDCNNLVSDKIYFKNPEYSRFIYLFITNSIIIFQNTITVAIGLSDFHKMIVTVCKVSFPKSRPKEIGYKNCMKFDIDAFQGELKLTLIYQ